MLQEKAENQAGFDKLAKKPELTIRAKVTKQVRNLAYINAEIVNSKGELCNEGEAIYFLMNQEKAREMGFLHCEVEE